MGRLHSRRGTAKIPIIAFAACPSHRKRRVDEWQKFGFADWVDKPFRFQELLAKIRQVLSPAPSPA